MVKKEELDKLKKEVANLKKEIEDVKYNFSLIRKRIPNLSGMGNKLKSIDLKFEKITIENRVLSNQMKALEKRLEKFRQRVRNTGTVNLADEIEETISESQEYGSYEEMVEEENPNYDDDEIVSRKVDRRIKERN